MADEKQRWLTSKHLCWNNNKNGGQEMERWRLQNKDGGQRKTLTENKN